MDGNFGPGGITEDLEAMNGGIGGLIFMELAGYKLDGCTPEALLGRMSVRDGFLLLPDGMSYRALILPHVPSMTPRLLRKILVLVQAGATVIGSRPVRSPSLMDYPSCDAHVQRLADELWGESSPAAESAERIVGKGRVKSMAQVKVNGTTVGILWTPPFRAEITAAIRPGINTLEVRVVNLWPNRMIGDQLLPSEKRFTSSTWNPCQKDSPLLESGLLGPVEVYAEVAAAGH